MQNPSRSLAERPRFASRLNPGPATNVAPLAPPYSATARRRWAPAAMQQKGQPRSANTKPSTRRRHPPRPHPSTTTPDAPTSISLEAKRFGRWPPRTTGLPTTESKGETKDEAQQQLAGVQPSSCVGRRRLSHWLLVVQGVGTQAWRQPSRRLFVAPSLRTSMGLAYRQEARPREPWGLPRRRGGPAGRTRCPQAQDASPQPAHAPRQASERRGRESPIGFNAPAGGAPRSTPRASTPMRSAWFSDSGLVEKVQNGQGLFMYFKRFARGVRRHFVFDGAFGGARGAWRKRSRSARNACAARIPRARRRRRRGRRLKRANASGGEYANDGGHRGPRSRRLRTHERAAAASAAKMPPTSATAAAAAARVVRTQVRRRPQPCLVPEHAGELARLPPMA